MANITETTSPARVTFSKNPIVVSGSIDELEDVKEVFLDLKDSNNEVVTLRFVNPYFPDPDTPVNFEFEFRDILDALLEFAPTTTHLGNSSSHFQSYQYRLYTNLEVEAGTNDSIPYTTKYVLQGYLPATELRSRIGTALSAPLTLLTRQPAKPARFDHALLQDEYLYLLLAYDSAFTGVEMVADLIGTDGASSTETTQLAGFASKNYQVTCVSVYEALESILGADIGNKLEYKVYFRLKNGSTTIYETYPATYSRDDTLNELHQVKRLVFQNSWGGLDTINLVGDADRTLSVKRKTNNNGAMTDYNYIADTQLPRANPYTSITSSEKVKAYLGTGHSKAHIAHLRELITSPQVWKLDNNTGQLLPVQITTNSIMPEVDLLGVRKIKIEYMYDFPVNAF